MLYEVITKLATRFAALGASVTLADQAARQQEIEGRILAAGHPDSIRFAATELPNPPAAAAGAPYDIIVLRHGLCQLPYNSYNFV